VTEQTTLKEKRRPAANGTAQIENASTDNNEYSASARKWEWCLFRVATEAGGAYRYGSAWRSCGIHYRPRGWFVVVHLPSGRRLTEFDRLAVARRFCEAIDQLADWSTTGPAITPELGIQAHREALRLTGARPDLRMIEGGVQ
jgi:hypothetical protein